VDCSLATGNNDGTSPTDAFQSYTSVASGANVNPGDTVLFKYGATCTMGSTFIDITDASTTWGCYDGVGDSTCESIAILTGANMPKFDGGGTYPTSEYDPLIRVSANGVTVQDLFVYDSAGHGIEVDSGYDNATIQRNRAETIYRQGIFGNNSANSVFQDNVGIDIETRHEGSCTANGGECMGCDGGCDNTIFRRNLVDGCYSECFGAYGNLNSSAPVVFEDNDAWNCRSANYHGGDSEIVLRYNLGGAYDPDGDNDHKYWYEGTWPDCTGTTRTGGIALESSTLYAAFASKYWVYGNHIFGMNTTNVSVDAPGIACSIGAAAYGAGDTIECHIYNNTSIDNEVNYRMNKDTSNPMGIESYAKNNVSAFYDASGTHCVEYDPKGESNWDFNFWGSTPASACQGGNDATYADPLLETQSGYNWPTNRTTITRESMKLGSTSPAIGDSLEYASNLGSPYNQDYWDNTRGEDGYWDFGAHEYQVAGGGEESADITVDLH
jgi:hypothetical protein